MRPVNLLAVVLAALLLAACSSQLSAVTPAAPAVDAGSLTLPGASRPVATVTAPSQVSLGVAPVEPVTTAEAARPVTRTLPVLTPSASALRVLYRDETLHVWYVAEDRVEDLGWPDAAVDCLWLAPDGHTLYFSDDEGARRIDLFQPQPAQLLVAHFNEGENPARHRRFCVIDQSQDGSRLLLQARDQYWYQLGVLALDPPVLRVVESPFGPAGEPWHCPGAGLWGEDAVLFVTGYSSGRCSQFPGLHMVRWGAPLVPTPVVTGTLPPVADRPGQRAGAWMPTRSPDGKQIAFWLDAGWARKDGSVLARALYVIGADGSNPRRLIAPIPLGDPVAWAGDSSAIFYTTSHPFNALRPHDWQIHRLSVESGVDEVVADLVASRLVLLMAERDGWLPLLTLGEDMAYTVQVLNPASGEIIRGPSHADVLGWLK